MVLGASSKLDGGRSEGGRAVTLEVGRGSGLKEGGLPISKLDGGASEGGRAVNLEVVGGWLVFGARLALQKLSVHASLSKMCSLFEPQKDFEKGVF